MGTVTHDFDAQGGYNSGSGVNELYTPALGANGPTGWRYLASDTSRAVTYPFRAVAYGGGDITVAIDWYAESLTAGTITWVASIAAQNPTGSGESAEAPANATTVSGNGTIASTSKASVRTIITIPQASADGLSADWLGYLRIYRNDATADAIICHRVSVSYSDGINAPLQGPASSTVGHIATLNNTSGTLLADSGIPAANVALGAASSTAGHVPSFTDTGGKQLSDSGLVAADIVQSDETASGVGEIVVWNDSIGRRVKGGGSSLSSVVKNTGPGVTDGHVVMFYGTSGLDIRDAGVVAANLVAAASPTTGDAAVWNGTIWVPKFKAVLATTATQNLTGTLTDITGLTVALPRAGTYKFRFFAQVNQTVATASTRSMSVNFTGTVTNTQYGGVINSAAATAAFGATTTNNAAITSAASAAATVTGLIAMCEGAITVSTTGTLSFRMSQSASTNVVQIGASGFVVEQ